LVKLLTSKFFFLFLSCRPLSFEVTNENDSFESHRSIVQPGIERAHDPALQSQFSSFFSTATSTLSTAARTGGQVLSTGLETSSQFLKRDLGVDVGDLGANFLDRNLTGRGVGQGYGRIGEEWAPSGQSRQELGDQGDFFEDQLGGGSSGSGTPQQISGSTTTRSNFRDQEDGTGFRDIEKTVKPQRVVSPIQRPPPPPAPQVEGDWNSFAPKAAAARAAKEAEAAKKKQVQPETKEKDGWDDFEDF
jgi:ADP-ribosylation factor GTPase-activating protein 1